MELMIMAQDFTAYEPVSSGVQIRFEDIKVSNTKPYMRERGDGTRGIVNETHEEIIDRLGHIWCNNSHMGTYSHDRAIEIMKQLAGRNQRLTELVFCATQISVDGNVTPSHGDSWTFYMPKE